MRILKVEMERTVDSRDPYALLGGLQAQLDAARRLIAELEAKLGERPAEEWVMRRGALTIRQTGTR